MDVRWDSITALPLSAADMRKSWHKDITQDHRDFRVCLLVEDMSTGDPAEDIKDLVTDAQNIERNIYESANGKEEYRKLMEEKRSELEKRWKSGEMTSTSRRSTPSLPLGDKYEDWKLVDEKRSELRKKHWMGTGGHDGGTTHSSYLSTTSIGSSSSVYGSRTSRGTSDFGYGSTPSIGSSYSGYGSKSNEEPRVSDEMWFHRDIKGLEAESILKSRGIHGSFLIRPRPSKTILGDLAALAARVGDKVIHIRIQNTGDYYDLDGGKKFATLSELVEYYIAENITLKDKDDTLVQLKYPLNCHDPTAERWFHRDITGHLEAESILKSQGIHGSFLVRPRPRETMLGDIALNVRVGDKVIHIRIQNTGDYYDLYGGEKFATLSELVEYYTAENGSLELKDGTLIELKYPLNCYDPTAESLDSITALPERSWHKDFTERSRDCYVRCLVDYMRTGDPAEDIKDLVTDAQNIERNMYDSANGKEEYEHLLSQKISELMKKSQMSREMKQSDQMEMKSKSTPPLPLGDKGIVTSQGSLTPPSSTAEGVKHGEMEDTPDEKKELDVAGDRRLQHASDMPQDKSESFQHSPEEMMSCDTACDLSTTDHPVTESLSSVHRSLELQDESIALPRSHSLPSLSQIPCLENKTSFRAKRSHSVDDVTLLDKTQQITPDIIVVENKESYRFHCTQAGLFQCSVTDLVFKMETEGDLTYRTVPWHRRVLSQLDQRPAGPLFDIKGTQESVCQLHFPHCEILSTGGGKSLSVVHVMDDDGIELIKPHVITETHVIINVTGLSLFGIISEMWYGPNPVHALVSLFYTPPIDDDHPSSILKVLVLPRNVVLSEVLKERRKLNGEEIYIGNPPCKLIPKQEYTLSTSPQDDSIKIQPNKAEFEVDELSYRDYIETFDVILKRRLSCVSVLLSSSKTSHCPWERDVDLSAAALRKHQVQRTPNYEAKDRLLSVRSSFIDSVSHPILNNVLDKLFEKGVIIKEEYDEACVKQVKQEKARCVIDTVRSKGTAASLKLIFILRETDPFLSEDLGLM